MNGIISSSKLTLRYWREVHSRMHSLCVSGCQDRLSPYLPPTYNTFVHKRCISAAKVLDKRPIPMADKHATTATYNTFVHHRWKPPRKVFHNRRNHKAENPTSKSTHKASAEKTQGSPAKVFDKRPIPEADIPASTATGILKGSPPPSHFLCTLNQNHLGAVEYVRLSGRASITVHFPLAPEEPDVKMRYTELGDKGVVPFPLNCHGFFYWHLDPDAPPVSGQVRFRIVRSSDPANFPSGHDLQLPDGQVWNISLLDIARRPQYSGLRAHLLSEALVTKTVLGTALFMFASYPAKHRIDKSSIPATAAARIPVSSLALHTLNQTKLAVKDFVDLSGRLPAIVRFPVVHKARNLEMHYSGSGGGERIPFPPNSRGFLYCHLDRDAPPVSGQVRFRTMRSSDLDRFQSGWDLQLPDGQTWNISLLDIARRTEYSGLRAQLLSEGLVTKEVLGTALNISASYADDQRIDKPVILANDAARIPASALPWTTLNQTRLHVEDFVDLSGRFSTTVRFPVAPEAPGIEIYYSGSGGSEPVPFPPDSHGFFYWHLEPDAPPLSGQVRFRTTTSSEPSTFPSGRDLHLPDGRPWNISLFDIVRRSWYSGLRALLLSELWVTPKLLDTAVMSARQRPRIDRSSTGNLLIWKFGQQFPVNLPSFRVSVWIIGSSSGERLTLPSLSSILVRESESAGTCYVLSESSDLRDSPETGEDDSLDIVDGTPFEGRALVQFERSTLPEHKGTRTVVLRIVGVMKKSDGSDEASSMPELQEDGLAMTRIHQDAWSLNVDQPLRGSQSLGQSAKALSILFDNEAVQERGAQAEAKS
ncbi:hypothetical protein OE88DRAFT_1807102 [Heliocybe sulcata]|uniref:Uncharacterized protein n=1 Tax=Heliocybe sulcata TaxID=5364 RepID=A0A5C3N319_9AGAM|nr:hypothetical protein OE88DRAFT_1807102 [Heliocybe sulcata]